MDAIHLQSSLKVGSNLSLPLVNILDVKITIQRNIYLYPTTENPKPSSIFNGEN
jgi:hypothetical protein